LALGIWKSGRASAVVWLEVDTDAVLTTAAATLRRQFGVEHATLQVESDARHCRELSW
jgi:hypothetical protein